MSEFVRGIVGKTVIIAAFAFCLGLAAILAWEYSTVGKFANDFSVYWRTANNPVEQAYSWQGRFPFPYAPTMLFWIQPLAGFPKWVAFFLFNAVSIIALVCAIRPYLPKAAIALTLISPSMVRGLYTGQVSALLAAAMIWACGTPYRAVAGMTFGLIATVKPQLVIMAPLLFVLNRDWRAFVWSGGMFLAIVILSLLLFGPARWPEWVASMPHFRSMVVDTNVIGVGVSPAVLAQKFGLNPLPFLILGTLAGAALVYLCRDMGPLEKATAVGLGSIMAAPYALVYDLVIVVPLLAMLLFRGRIEALVGIAAFFHPIPMLVTVYELLRNLPAKARVRAKQRLGHV